VAPKRGLPKPFGVVAAGNGHQAAAPAGSVAGPVLHEPDAVIDLRPGASDLVPASRNGSQQPPAGGGSNETGPHAGAATMPPAAPLGGYAAPAAGYRTAAAPRIAAYAPPAYPAPAPAPPAYPAPAPPGPGAEVARRGPRRLIAEPKRERRGMGEQVRRMAIPLAIFAASRALIYTVLLFAERLPGAGTTTRLLAGWQGVAYLSVASRGYPQALVSNPGGSELGYFPLYPMLIRSLHRLSGLSFVQSAIGIALICSALAMVVAWLVVQRLTDQACATRAVVLLSFFPWAFVLSMVYSEGLLLLLAGVCLLALLDGQWVTAGLAALLAGVSAPFGFVLFFPCAWAAARELRRSDTVGALIAPVLAPVGVLGFFLYLRARTGNVFEAILAQARGVTYAGIGRHPGAAAKVLSAFLRHPTANLNVLTSLLAAVLVVAGLIMMAQWKPPAVIWAYTVPLVLLGLWLDTFGSLPRTILVAFPLVVAIAWRIRRSGFLVLAGVSAGLMATLFVVTGLTTALTP
jgi:hypothetical protein